MSDEVWTSTTTTTAPLSETRIVDRGHFGAEALARPSDVAAYLGLALVTLSKWRQRGKGPKWIKAGTAVRYEWAEVRRWVQAGGDR